MGTEGGDGLCRVRLAASAAGKGDALRIVKAMMRVGFPSHGYVYGAVHDHDSMFR